MIVIKRLVLIFLLPIGLLIGTTQFAFAENDKTELKREFREERRASTSALKKQFKLETRKIRDEKKQLIAEKFVEKMNRVNQKRVEHWRKVLARLIEILALISSKLGASNSSVQIATEKLATAQAAVDAQEGKVYDMNIGTESALKSNAGQAMASEQSDLRTVLNLVNEARKAVHDALRVLKQKPATPTATPSAVPTL